MLLPLHVIKGESLMSNIKNAFENKKAFISFITAGDPSMEKTEEYILDIARAGSDLIEIGIPFSDPVAEGKVIEAANGRALQAGATTDKVFEMVKRVRKQTNVPLVFLTYMNPVFVYGVVKFFKQCKDAQIDGIIVPDLPFEERGEISNVAEEFGVDLITLIAPTSKERIKMLAENSKGFIYLVSSMGTTGVRSNIETDLESIIKDIRTVTKTPIAVGFGISTKTQAREISKTADGIIVGSAIVKIIAEHGANAHKPLSDYVNNMSISIRSC